jgi:uncharacterized membrane protein YfcA
LDDPYRQGLLLSIFEIIVIVLFTAAGAIVQGGAGIGLALVAGPALVFIDPAFVPGPLMLAAQATNIRHIVVEGEHLDRNICRRALYGVPVGLIAGLFVLSTVDETTMAVIVGSATALAAIVLLAGFHVVRTPRTEMVAGMLTALATVTASLPGPPIIVALNDLEAKRLRPTCSAIILFVSVFALIGLLATGNFGADEVRLTAWLVPGIFLGMSLARWARPHMDGPRFRPTVLTIALVGGIALVVRSVT